MIGSRTSMHTEFSTNFSTSHLTENCSNRFAAKIVGRGEVCDMGCGPGQVARHLPGIALADQESSGFKRYRFPQHVRGNSSQKACLHPGLVLRGTATRSTERGRKATHWKRVAKVPKQRGWTARLRLVSPHGNAWEISARQCRSAAVQTYRRAGITIPAVSKAGPPVSAADD